MVIGGRTAPSRSDRAPTEPFDEAARLELWASRAGSLRNVCAFLSFGSFSYLGFLVLIGAMVDPRARTEGSTLWWLDAGAIGFAAGAFAARRRPFATGLVLTVVAWGAWALLAIGAHQFFPVAWQVEIFLVLCAYWPLSFLGWTIDLAGADRWICRPSEAPASSGAAARLARGVVLAIATPLGWALLLLFAGVLAFVAYDAWQIVSRATAHSR